MGDLIDTTEMYLKTILEMEEDGVTPLRARIVDRLGHSGPTVSQTVGRMERDGLLHVLGDRRLELTDEGRALAIGVLRKHRLAERLLIDVIGLEWRAAHEEACRWEHVMSKQVEDRLLELLEDPQKDPYGNPIPISGARLATRGHGVSAEVAVRHAPTVLCTVLRIGEPIQAEIDVIEAFDDVDIRPGAQVEISAANSDAVKILSVAAVERGQDQPAVVIPMSLAPHFFVETQKEQTGK
ncbi:metal-dependent transcriptional regulator [Schaalia suimastitidis]|uniref:metal-dependent transcriptional regulator n=1 Tax=Schaalia suimastitidis TaxID=121163 RepID=UPI000404036F|nr:metal-dependent transcriptional regulator [Schaalia suimastitidis]